MADSPAATAAAAAPATPDAALETAVETFETAIAQQAAESQSSADARTALWAWFTAHVRGSAVAADTPTYNRLADLVRQVADLLPSTSK